MLIVKNPQLIKSYILEDDKDNENPTKFYYKLPSLALQHNLFAEITDKVNIGLDKVDALLLACLVKIENLKMEDENGNLVDIIYNEKTSEQQKKKILEALPIQYRSELAGVIFNEMSLNKEEEKNW